MKQNNNRKLNLKKTTVANLTKEQLGKVQGGSLGELVTGAIILLTEVIIGITAFAFTEGMDDGRTNRTK